MWRLLSLCPRICLRMRNTWMGWVSLVHILCAKLRGENVQRSRRGRRRQDWFCQLFICAATGHLVPWSALGGKKLSQLEIEVVVFRGGMLSITPTFGPESTHTSHRAWRWRCTCHKWLLFCMTSVWKLRWNTHIKSSGKYCSLSSGFFLPQPYPCFRTSGFWLILIAQRVTIAGDEDFSPTIRTYCHQSVHTCVHVGPNHGHGVFSFIILCHWRNYRIHFSSAWVTLTLNYMHFAGFGENWFRCSILHLRFGQKYINEKA